MKITEAAAVKRIEFPNAAAMERYLANLRVDRKNYRIICEEDYGDKYEIVIIESWRNAPMMKKIMV